MINIQYTELNAFLKEKILTTGDLKRATSIALGVAVSKLVPLPSSATDEITYQFDTVTVHTVFQYLSEFNENIVIDIDLAKETARAYWLMRYSAAHPDPNALSIPRGVGGFTEKIFNLSAFVNPKTLEYVNKYSEVMVVCVNRIQMLLKEVSIAEGCDSSDSTLC